jgi:F0F1-type ATP synthase gamma subunit
LIKKSFIKHNGKTIFILISANTGLYGDIIRRTFDLFAKAIKKEAGDIAIIGRIGLKQFREVFPKKNFMYFELSDDKIDLEALKKIIPHIVQYEKVLVFYQQFQSIITSQPIITSVSGDILPTDKSDSGIKYIFEPSLEKIMAFFEQQISGSIFEQTVYESQLAKFSSRLVTLDKATENIQKNLKTTMLQKERIKHQYINKEQNQRLASMSLWQR